MKNLGLKIALFLAGTNVVDKLHKSSPWRGEVYGREGFWQCWTKQRLEKGNVRCCTRRSLVYESWCISCKGKETEEIKKTADDMKIKKGKKKKGTHKKHQTPQAHRRNIKISL